MWHAPMAHTAMAGRTDGWGSVSVEILGLQSVLASGGAYRGRELPNRYTEVDLYTRDEIIVPKPVDADAADAAP